MVSRHGLKKKMLRSVDTMMNFLTGREKLNFYIRVNKHEDIKAVIFALKSALKLQRDNAATVLDRFKKFKELWSNDKERVIKVLECTSGGGASIWWGERTGVK